MASSPASDDPICAVLVHGTFARDAAWTQPSRSSLCHQLRQTLGRNLTFEAPQWSGANSHAARVEGGQVLAHHLEDLLTQRPAPRLFVIGHSHGGTVIAQALRARPDLARAIDGIVFLSTPFIQIRRRPHATALATLLGLLLCGAVIWIAGQVELLIDTLQWPSWIVTVASSLATLLLAGVVINAVYESRPKSTRAKRGKIDNEVELVSRIDIAVEGLRDEFSVKHLNPDRTLFVRANADEASAALAWVQAVSRLLGDLVEGLLRLGSAMLPWNAFSEEARATKAGVIRLVASLVAVVLLIGLIVGAVVVLIPELADLMIGAAMWFGLDLGAWASEKFPKATTWSVHGAELKESTQRVLVPAMKVAGAVGVAALVLLGLMLTVFYRAFGHWFTWTALFVEVSVEPTPPGRWTLCQIEPLDQSIDWKWHKTTTLTHALSYEDARAQRMIARWIRRRLRGSGSAGTSPQL